MCPICKSSAEYELTTERYGYEILKCINIKCSHFFYKNSYPGQGIDEREDSVSTESDQALDAFKDRNERLLKNFLKVLPPKNKYIFLDFGSGVAHISRSFKKSLKDRVEIICFEPNKDLKGFYDNFSLEQIFTLNQVNKEYDLIYLIEVIEHLDDPKETLSQILKVMNKDTKLYISTPKAQTHPDGNCYHTPAHIQFFSDTSLNFLLDELGFKKIEFKYIPEMYPFNSVKYQLEKYKSFIINFLLSLGLEFNYEFKNHLVGFTELK